MENQKTEVVDLNVLLEQARASLEQPKAEISADKVFEELIGTEEVVTLEELAKVAPAEEVLATPKVAAAPKAEDTQYNKKLKELIELGLIKDYQVTIGEGEDAKELYFSEFENLDKEGLEDIIRNCKEIEQKEIDENYISSKGLTDRAKQYLEIDKAGGDITQLLQEEKEYVSPISTYDLETEYGQEALVRADLRNKGIRPNVINATIDDMKADFTLDAEAKQIATDVTSTFDKYVEKRKQEQLAENKATEEAKKEARKNLNLELKEFKNLNETQRKVILDNATNINQYGITNSMQMYFDIEKDPKKYAQLVVFMNNPEAYKNAVQLGVANKAKISTAVHSFKVNPRVVKEVVVNPQTNSLADAAWEKLMDKNK